MKRRDNSDDAHEFHFKDCVYLNRELAMVSRFFDFSKSYMICYMLESCIPMLENLHIENSDRGARYRKVEVYEERLRDRPREPVPDRKTIGIHFHLPEDLYRRLKQLHADLNFFSIAQLVRWVIRFYLALLREVNYMGDKVMEFFWQLKVAYSRLKRKICRSKWKNKEKFIRQLLNKIPDFTNQFIVYDPDFKPDKIFYF